MDTLTDTITNINAGINEATGNAISSFQEQVLAFHRDVAAALGKIELPTWLPTPEPTATLKVDELVKQAFDFQAARIEADRAFLLGLVDIWAGATKPAVPVV